jgi:hypothetical protein
MQSAVVADVLGMEFKRLLLFFTAFACFLVKKLRNYATSRISVEGQVFLNLPPPSCVYE